MLWCKIHISQDYVKLCESFMFWHNCYLKENHHQKDFEHVNRSHRVHHHHQSLEINRPRGSQQDTCVSDSPLTQAASHTWNQAETAWTPAQEMLEPHWPSGRWRWAPDTAGWFYFWWRWSRWCRSEASWKDKASLQNEVSNPKPSINVSLLEKITLCYPIGDLTLLLGCWGS